MIVLVRDEEKRCGKPDANDVVPTPIAGAALQVAAEEERFADVLACSFARHPENDSRADQKIMDSVKAPLSVRAVVRLVSSCRTSDGAR